MDTFTLSRTWFNFCFENPEKIKPSHTALYFFCIEHCNRLGGKEKFGLPTTMVKEAIGIHSYNTYITTLKDLVNWGFIKMVEISKNQYSSNIIALSKFNKALDKALDKALIKHGTKQSESTVQSINSIDKQVNKETSKQGNIIPEFLNDKNSLQCNLENFKTFYNENNGTTPDIKLFSETRLKTLKSIFNTYSKEEIKTAVKKIGYSDFLQGKNNNSEHKNWMANFDFIFKPNNFLKLVEGTFDNKGQNNIDTKDLEFEERKAKRQKELADAYDNHKG